MLLCLSFESESARPERWPLGEIFEKYDAQTMFNDLFVRWLRRYGDPAADLSDRLLQPTDFNTTERNSAVKKKHPDRFILNGAFDPRDGSQGLEDLHAKAEQYKLQGVKLYTAEWRGESKGLQADRQGIL